MSRLSLLPLVLICGVSPATAQVMPVQAPTPPPISMPSPAQSPAQAPTVDDVMTLGRPPASPMSVSNPPVLQRPATSMTASPASALPLQQGQQTALPGALSGSAKVFDGNTLVLGGKVLVLDGADAPELDQICGDATGAPWRCGEKSFNRLSNLVGERSVTCLPIAALEGGYSATCRIGKDDLGSIMVREGLAVAFVGIPNYLGEEASARSTNRGVWAGRFDLPWVYRSIPSSR